ncbi:jg18735, partial [Pararge aegeria aegeria]
ISITGAMGELSNKLGLNELSGGATGISKALLAEFIGKLNIKLSRVTELLFFTVTVSNTSVLGLVFIYVIV